MLPDPIELKTLDDAILTFETAYGVISQVIRPNEAFDNAFVNLVQAVNRIRLIYSIEKLKDVKAAVKVQRSGNSEVSDPEKNMEMTGNFCPRCHSMNLRNKGGGCIVCLSCGFDLGCGS